MQTHTLSFDFQLMMAIFTGLFWLLGLIPFVNMITNIIYWMIWIGIFIYKYLPLIKSIAKQGVAIGTLGFKIGTISFVAFILGEIPLVSLLPWAIISNFLTNRMIRQLLDKVEKIKTDAKTLAEGYDRDVKQKMMQRRSEQRMRQGGYKGAAG